MSQMPPSLDSGQNFPSPETPILRTPESGWWIGAGGLVLAIAAFLAPQLAQLPAIWRVVIVAGAFLLLVLVLFVRKLVSVATHWWRLKKHYPALYERHRSLRVDNESLRKAVMHLAATASMFNPQKMYRLRGSVYLEFERAPGRALGVGSKVVLVDLSDGFVFGHFNVVEVRSRAYQAVESDDLNSVLRGHMIETTSSLPPPCSFVIPVPTREVAPS